MRVFRKFFVGEQLERAQKALLPIAHYTLERPVPGLNGVINFSPNDRAVREVYDAVAAKLKREPEEGYSVDLLPYATGHWRNEHVDVLLRPKEHWRMIVCLEAPTSGGALFVKKDRTYKTVYLDPGDAAQVCVSHELHGVNIVEGGRRVVISIGGKADIAHFLSDFGADAIRQLMREEEFEWTR